MSDDPGIAMLTTLGEAGGITGLVAIALAMLVRMIKKRGCTCKINNCSGGSVVEVDCEEGAPNERFVPPARERVTRASAVVEPPDKGDSL